MSLDWLKLRVETPEQITIKSSCSPPAVKTLHKSYLINAVLVLLVKIILRLIVNIRKHVNARQVHKHDQYIKLKN